MLKILITVSGSRGDYLQQDKLETRQVNLDHILNVLVVGFGISVTNGSNTYVYHNIIKEQKRFWVCYECEFLKTF